MVNKRRGQHDFVFVVLAMKRHEDAEMLTALKQSLRDLENVKLLSPDDVEIVALKTSLRQKVACIEDAVAEGK